MGKKYNGNDSELQVLDAWIKLSRATNTVLKYIRPTIENSGFTISQFGVLELLLHRGPQTQKTISGKLLISAGNMVTVIDNLERAGLVSRRPYPGDRRSYLIHLENKGNKLITRTFKEHLKDLMAVFDVLTDAEKSELGRLSKKLGVTFNKRSDTLVIKKAAKILPS